jgi:hypothetical protein
MDTDRFSAHGLVATLAAMAFAAALAPLPVAAHAERPATTIAVAAGPYRLVVGLYADPPRAGDDLPLVVAPAPGDGSALWAVRVVARPGLGTNATPTRATLTRDPDEPGSFAGAVRLPVTGAWLLGVAVDGAQGEAAATVSVTAAAPGALPAWVGWLIGVVVPLGGVLWFAAWQRAYLRRLEREGAPGYDAAGR